MADTDEPFSESEDGLAQLESPGTLKVNDLSANEIEGDEPEVCAKFMRRPISSGSAEPRDFTYGAPPKRDLRIAKKQAATLSGVSQVELHAKSKANEPIKGDTVAVQTNDRQSPLDQTSDVYASHERHSESPLNPGRRPSDESRASDTDKIENRLAEQKHSTHLEQTPREGRPSKRGPMLETSRKSFLAHAVNSTTSGKRPGSFSVLPISRAGSAEHEAYEHSGEPVTLCHAEGGHVSPRIATDAEMSNPYEQPGPIYETAQVVDLTRDDRHHGQRDSAPHSTTEDDSPTNVGSPRDNGHSCSSEPGGRNPRTSAEDRRSVEKAHQTPKTPSRRLRPDRVVKNRLVPPQQPSSLPSGNSGVSTGRVPSEEDLYFLLLHRYRKREQTERQLATRLRQVETENKELAQTAQEYQQRFEASITSSSKQAAEMRAQKMVINDIKDGYLKIKEFMTNVYNDQKALKAKATSVDQDRQALRGEHDYILCAIKEANDATMSSNNSMNKIKTHVAHFRQETARLETSIHDANSKLRTEQRLLVQERSRNTNYENHIAGLTRQQQSFSFTIQQEQQHVLNALKSIRHKLSNLEADHVVAASPPNIPALDQCVEMLTTLTKLETASPADVTDMVRVVHELAESIDSFQKQSRDSSQRAATARVESDSNLLSQITAQFNTLVRNSGNQDHIAELLEAKNTLEERVRGNENMLTEIRTSKVSAEKRETYLRAGNDKLLEELCTLREMALTPKKDSGPMTELQQLSMKYTRISSVLAESRQRIEVKDQKLQGQEQQIRTLSEQLDQVKAEQQKSTEEVRELSRRLTERADTAIREEGQLLAAKELCINNLREELKNLKSTNIDKLKEIEQVNSVHETLTQELDESRCRLSQVVRDRTTAESTIDCLNQQLVRMNDLCEQADRVPGLARECEVNTGTVVDLQQELESLKLVNQQLRGHRIDAETKAVEISELQTRLQIAEATSQHFFALQEELQRYKEEMRPLIGAQERADLLEIDLRQRNDRINQLNVEIGGYNDALGEIDNLQKQLGRRRGEHESVKKGLKAAEKGAARTPILKKELTAQKDENSELGIKLAEAEKICTAVPEMQAQIHHFSDIFSKLKRELDNAHQTAEELQSTKAANATLHQTIVKLQEETAVAEQASDSLKCLNEEMQGRDAQIIALRMELALLRIESQGRKGARDANTEDSLHTDIYQQTSHLAEDSLVHQEDIGHSIGRPNVENEAANTVQKKDEPRKERKRANRSASSLEANPHALGLMKKSSESTGPRLDPGHETAADDGNGGHAPVEQHLDEITVVPESQPRAHDFGQSPATKIMRDRLAGSIFSSSPLSDIGELFDPSDQDQSAVSLHYTTQIHSDQMVDTTLSGGVAGIKQTRGKEDSLSNDRSQGPESPHRSGKLQEPGRGSRPPSSSYGEPLLLDDLEGVGSLQASSSMNTVPGKQSTTSTQDVLTSPLGTLPRKALRNSMRARPSATSLLMSDLNAADPIEYSQYLPKDPSPRRLRSSEPASQTSSRQPLQDLGDDATNMRPATPRSSVKEKHQPNSAIKRKSEAGGVSVEIIPAGKKRARRNLSNVEVTNRRGTASQSLSSSTPDAVGQPLTRLRQSSSSSTGSRSTNVGMIAPAPGNRKQGPKKPRGGSNSEECLIITISRRC